MNRVLASKPMSCKCINSQWFWCEVLWELICSLPASLSVVLGEAEPLPPANPKCRYLGNTLHWLKQAKAKKNFKRETSAGLTGLGAMLYRSGRALPALQLLQCLSGTIRPPSIDQLSCCCNCRLEEIEFELPWKSQGEQAPLLGMDTREYPGIYWKQCNSRFCTQSQVVCSPQGLSFAEDSPKLIRAEKRATKMIWGQKVSWET